MRNSKSSSGVHSVPSFALSHSAFSFPPILVERFTPYRRFCERLCPACLSHPQRCLAPTRATSGSRPGTSVPRGIALSSMVSPMRPNFSCASLAASTCPKVFYRLYAQSILPHWGRLPGTVPGKPSVSGGESVVTSDLPASLGKRILLMDTCSSQFCPSNMGHKASTISSSSCAYEARASRGTTVKGQGIVQDNGNHFSRQYSKSASHIRQIPSARTHTFCNLSLAGSCSPSLAVPKIMRPFRVQAVHWSFLRSRPCFSSVSLSSAMTSGASSAVVLGEQTIMEKTHATIPCNCVHACRAQC